MAKILGIDKSKYAVGDIMPIGQSSSLVFSLACDGSAVSRTAYAKLFAAIGTTYGSGDGSTTFNLPDSRSRSFICSGQGVGLTSRVLGTTGGAETQSLSSIPAHTHTGSLTSSGSHQDHSYTGTNVFTMETGGITGCAYQPMNTAAVSSDPPAASWASHQHSFTLASEGSGAAHNNIHPMLVVNCAIAYW